MLECRQWQILQGFVAGRETLPGDAIRGLLAIRPGYANNPRMTYNRAG